MGIVSEMLDALGDVCKANKVKTLKSVTVAVGEASMVVPSYLSDCWDASIFDTPFKNTKLIIKMVVADGVCNKCGHTFPIKENDRKCPYCGEIDNFITTTGRDIQIEEVEAVED
jgi:hydrogenase nickel incorporation protein HypA/HybF